MIVHVKTAIVPTGTPVTADVGSEGLVITAVPLKTLHTPVPTNAVLPANVKVPKLQIDWGVPAFETVVRELFVNVTVVAEVQAPFVIVQVKTALVPTGTPVTADTSDVGTAITAVPLETVQNPVPTAAVLPANVKFPELQFD